jgi:hypothetical protein
MFTLLQRLSFIRTAFVAVAIALVLPIAASAHSPRRDDDGRSNRSRSSHSRLHRDLARLHRNYHRNQYNLVSHRTFHYVQDKS